MEGNSHPNPRNPESPKQDKPKAKHPKTYINQINEDQTQRTNIKSTKRKTTNNTQGDSHKDNSSFKYEGEIKSFADKQKLREFSTTKPAFRQMLKDLYTERVYKSNPQTIK